VRTPFTAEWRRQRIYHRTAAAASHGASAGRGSGV